MKRIIILILVLILLGGCVKKIEEVKPEIKELKEDIDLSLDDYRETNVSVDRTNIFLTADCQQIIMSTIEVQTYSIAQGQEGKFNFRPWTHDLIVDLIEGFDMEVLMIKISDYKDETYYANLLVKKDEKILDLDARPSDAIAIAVRTNNKVYVRKDLLENYGKKIC